MEKIRFMVEQDAAIRAGRADAVLRALRLCGFRGLDSLARGSLAAEYLDTIRGTGKRDESINIRYALLEPSQHLDSGRMLLRCAERLLPRLNERLEPRITRRRRRCL